MRRFERARQAAVAASALFFLTGLARGAAECGNDATNLSPPASVSSNDGLVIPAPAAAERARGIHRIPSASAEIRVDGQMDEPLWESALRLDVAYEIRPGENLCTEIQTEAFLTYDDSHLYVAFRAHDPDPKAIRARLTDRDRAFQDDFVGIVVDTFNDERRAFEFFVNPLGVQMDLVQDDVSGNEDSSWDAIWDSAGRVTERGYEVEMAIPYTSLRFQRGDGDQTWGLDIIRIYPRDKRYQFALAPRDRDVNCYLCQVDKVTGFSGATPGKNLEITPTVTGVRNDRIGAGFPDGGLIPGDEKTDLGLTVKWGMTPNLTLSSAINPDFSQVEADVARLDVNEQFALFFPERRPFFLEGADFFETPFSVVHTRTVASPKWGAKVTGKEGKNAVGAFLAQDDLTSVLLPGSQRSGFDSVNDESTAGVARYRRDVGKNSAIGAVATLRSGRDYSNNVYGVDALLRPAQSDTIRVQLLNSDTEYPTQLATDNGQPQGRFSDQAMYFSYHHSPRNWIARASYSDLGRDFRSDLGFMPRVDTRMTVIGGGYTWWGEPENWYTRISVGGDWDLTEDQAGNLIERETEAWIDFGGPKQSYYFMGGGQRRRDFRADSFTQNFANYYFEFQPTGDTQLWLEGGVSDRVDFAFTDPTDPDRARQGDEFSIEPGFRVNFGRRLRLTGSHELRTLKRDGGTLFEANQSQATLIYQLNRRTFFRGIFQYTSVERDTALYPACVADPAGCGLLPENEDFFSQLLFSYKINPQTAIFVGYADSREGLTDETFTSTGLVKTDRTFFFKIGYAWVL